MDFAAHVKSQVDIVRTVAEYVHPLRRMGSRWVGLCPFHTEKTPSFGVSPSHGIFKCFGCGAKGDVIKFVQEIESLTFWEALKLLAERNGIPIPQRREQSDGEAELREAIFEMYETAARHYGERLYSSASEVRDYLNKRGVTQSVAQQFSLGYAERSWDDLLRRFGNRYNHAQLEASGLFGRRDDGGFYDKFRGRLIFPIHNESGKVIGFGGRSLRSEDEPKYLNSPETAVYKKSSVLYNLHRAKEAIRKSERTVLVEGYMDVIGVYAAGVHNVVASCGTALTAQQIRSMKRHASSVVVNFDPDMAGANATERSIQLLLDESMHVRILELTDGLDPDEFIKQYGADTYDARLRRATGYFIWLADRARKKFDMSTSEGRTTGFQTMLLPAIRRISDRLERATVATEVAEYLGIDRQLVLAEFRRMPAGARTGASRGRENETPHKERVLLRSLLTDPEVREILVTRLQSSKTAQRFLVWPLLTHLFALHNEEGRVEYADLEARVPPEAKTLLDAALFADQSEEVLSREQAEAFAELLSDEDSALENQSLEEQVRAAERAGNLDEAMRLAALIPRAPKKRALR
jgi:DNA primase